VIHFLGHGGFDEATHEGHLFFEDEYRHSVGVEADRFATLLASRDSIRLVVLNACEGGRVAADQPFGGVAHLVRRQLPAVIAMQFPISDRAAVAFSASLPRRSREDSDRLGVFRGPSCGVRRQ
jgi:CHAT domain-containing protein